MTSNAIARVVFVAAICLGFAATSKAQVSPQLAQKAPEANAIAAKAAQDGYVRIIVEFAGPVPTAQLRPDPQVLAPIVAEIAARQNAIIASHFGSATNPSEGQGFPRGLVRFQITPTFAVNVSPSELNALAADPAVLGIYYDHRGSASLPQSVPLIGMDAAYIANATGQRQAVAVIDSGVQTDHEFLSANVLPNAQACYSNGDSTGVSLCPNGQQTQTGSGAANNSIPACSNGDVSICSHGTHVAGIAAGNNTVAGALPANGVAKSAQIVPVQAFTRYNSVTACPDEPPCVGFRGSDLQQALEWIYGNALNPATGVRLAAVNLSLGFNGMQYGSACDALFTPLKNVIDMLRLAGVATVAASGNDGIETLIDAPACISTVVAVGSTDKEDHISDFSSMSQQVGLVAPGGFTFGEASCEVGEDNVNILSSISNPEANDEYDCLAGTSMAAPHVAGAFAAIRTVCPDATIDRISAALQTTGVKISYMTSTATQTASRISVDLARQALGCASHDFNGDGKSDILFRDNLGDTAVWLMNGAQVLSQGGIGAPPLTWSIVGQRDFDGDGKYDLLWRDTSGNTAIWFMNGTQVASTGSVGNVTGWSVVGTGDFNDDGMGDILWRAGWNGETAIWLMSGANVLSAGGLGAVPANWSVVGTGDFDGDGKSDILWRDTSGNTSIWFMNGTTVVSAAAVGNIPTTWTVAGTGDFNGDGKSDIVWRDNLGNTSIWLMNGAAVSSAGSLGNIPTTWSIAQTGDYNGDGLSDLLWRDTAGNTSIWFMGLMNGQLVVSTMTAIGNIPTTWTIQSVNAY